MKLVSLVRLLISKYFAVNIERYDRDSSPAVLLYCPRWHRVGSGFFSFRKWVRSKTTRAKQCHSSPRLVSREIEDVLRQIRTEGPTVAWNIVKKQKWRDRPMSWPRYHIRFGPFRHFRRSNKNTKRPVDVGGSVFRQKKLLLCFNETTAERGRRLFWGGTVDAFFNILQRVVWPVQSPQWWRPSQHQKRHHHSIRVWVS